MAKPIRWTISKKVGGTVFILLAFILALLVHSIVALKEIEAELSEVANIDVPLTEYANEVEIAQLEQRIHMDEVVRHKIAGSDVPADHITQIEFWGKKLYQQFGLAISTAKEGYQITQSSEFNLILTTLVKLQQQHKEIDALLQVVLDQEVSKEQIDEIILLDEAFDKVAVDLIHSIEKLTKRNAKLVLKHEEQFALINYSLGAIGAVIGIILAVLIIVSIKASINKLSRNIELVSSAIESNSDIPIDEVEQIKSSDEFSELSQNLTHMINQVSSDIDKREKVSERLNDLATKDHLTKCFNRFKWDEVSTLEVERSTRSKSPLSLISFDIDHFKRINDTYGHDIGDVTLAKVAELAKQNSRNIDSVYRLGGEEFSILLPDTDTNEAQLIAERLRTTIESFVFDSVKTVTVSLGVSQLNPEKDTLASFFKRVDEALYSAKQNGRNQVIVKLSE